MTEEHIPEIMYKELKHPTCPRCKEKLTEDEQGSWYCENFPGCSYAEYNNIGICQGECDELVLSPDINFPRMEHRYCQIERPDGGTCLGFAQHESEQAEAEHWEIMRHKETCNDDDCDCRNY